MGNEVTYMTLLDAKWITMPGMPGVYSINYDKFDGSYYFRRDFFVSEDIENAELVICMLGLGVCSINGRKVGDDVLSTPFTHYDKRVIYRRYDVTDYIHRGNNAIGMHIGNGMYCDNMENWNDRYAPWKDAPKVAAVLNITYKSGNMETVITDRTWKTKKGAAVYNHFRQGELFDARLVPCGFDETGFNDSEWETAKLIYEPGGIYEELNMPPIRIIRELKPISKNGDIYDFGENISGWAKIKVSGREGQKIELTYDECLDGNGELLGKINQFVDADPRITIANKDIFICSGRKDEEYHPEFCYHGFRYVKVENAPDAFEIVAEVVHTDLQSVGEFWCDDEMLNKIHQASRRSTLSNYVGIPTDCPHREQNGWTNDAQLSSNQTFMNFEIADAYKKWLTDLRDTQRPSGQLSGIAPQAGWGYNTFSGPICESAIFVIPWNAYLHTGRCDLIRDNWDAMVKNVGYMERMSVDYIADYGLWDWQPPSLESFCPTAVTSTAYFYSDCMLMGKMAMVIGKDSGQWYELAGKVRDAWRNRFMGDINLKKFQTYYACGIYNGLFDENEISGAAKNLASLVVNNGYRIDCGILGTKWIFNALCDNGYIDVIYKMVTNSNAPSYAHWINRGNTTLAECWTGGTSQNHHMFSEVDNWLYRYVAGIQVNETGITIKPYIIEGVNQVKAFWRGITVERKDRNVVLTVSSETRLSIDGENKIFVPGRYEFSL